MSHSEKSFLYIFYHHSTAITNKQGGNTNGCK
nr:MAG TPA_asm: hypothetical protein [Caudoviricetes sp.]